MFYYVLHCTYATLSTIKKFEQAHCMLTYVACSMSYSIVSYTVISISIRPVHRLSKKSSSSSECSAQKEVFRCKLRHQGCSSAQRQGFHRKLGLLSTMFNNFHNKDFTRSLGERQRCYPSTTAVVLMSCVIVS